MDTPRNCECCHVQLIEGGASETPGLCSKCDEAWQAFPKLAPSHLNAILGRALSHSAKDICRRLAVEPSAHASALGNAHRVTGIKREGLIRVAGWALRTGRQEKPAGFEDCTPNGLLPSPVQAHTRATTGSVVGGGPSEHTRDAARQRATTATKAAERAHGNFKPGTPPEKYPEPVQGTCSKVPGTVPCQEWDPCQVDNADLSKPCRVLCDHFVLDTPHIGDRAEDYPPEAPCNSPQPESEYVCDGPYTHTLQVHLWPPAGDPALEALKRLAESPGQGDLITVAYELGYTRGELARAS